MKKKMFILFTFILFSFTVFGQKGFPDKQDYQSYHGKRKTASSEKFELSGIRVLEASDEVFYIDLFFNSELNPKSIRPDSFGIFLLPENPDHPPLPPSNKGPIKYRFMKNPKSLRLDIPKPLLDLSPEQPLGKFTLQVQWIKSWDNKEIQPVKISDLELNSQYHYSLRENIWKKY